MTDHHDMPEPTGTDADSPLEPWFQALADDYHRPPPAPREAMWARIQAARAAGATGDGDRGDAAIVVMAPGTVTMASESAAGDDLARRRASRGGNASGNRRGLAAWAGPSLGLAAALLLAAGLAWRTRTPAAATTGIPAASTTVALAHTDSAPADAGQQSAATRSTVAVVADGRPAAPAGPDVDATHAGATDRRLPTAGSAANARLAAGREAGDGARPDAAISAMAAMATVGRDAAGDAAGAPYRLVAAQYLGQAEALLTVFRAESARDAADPSLQPWARELLTTTRLLLDSPAARDPRLGALLDELEPVLVQIVQLPAARVAEERQLIARSIERSDLMTQLRSAVPAGPAVPQRAGE